KTDAGAWPRGIVILQFLSTAICSSPLSRCFKRQTGDSQCKVDTDLAFDGKRLERDCLVRAAEQYVGSESQADGHIAACAHIGPCKCTAPHLRRRCEHGPGHGATSRDANIKAQASDPSKIDFRRSDVR